jgi:hypothetical protein
MVAKVTTQHVKPTIMALRYTCSICSNSKHHAPDCPINTKVYNMFRTKPTATTTVLTINPKLNNVLIM